MRFLTGSGAGRAGLILSPIVGLALVGCAETNTAPTTPSVGIGPEGATTLDDLVLQLDGEPADEDGDIVSLTVSWSLDGERRADLDGDRSVPSSVTRKGQTWSVSVTATDGSDVGEVSTAEITIGNAAPTARILEVPFAPDESTDLRVQAEGDDPDEDDTVSLDYAWTVDGADAGVSGPVVPSERTERGQVWEVTVTPTDGELSGEPVTATIDIDNRRPVAEAVTLTPATAFEDTTLTASGIGVDPDGDPVSLTWAWYVNGVEVARGEGNTLTGADFDRGEAVVAVAIPNDGFVDGAPVSSEPVEIQNTPPTLDSATIDQTEAFEETTLTCTAEGFADLDGDAEDVEIAWEVNGILATVRPELTGAFFDRGDRVVCVATPTDGQTEGRSVRSAPIRIQNTLPTIASVAIDQSAPGELDTLTVTPSGVMDVDGDPVTFTYRWSVDGMFAGTGPTLTGAAFDKGQDVTVVVTPNDGIGDGTRTASAPVTIVNTPPSITSVAIDPTEAFTDTDLEALVEAEDPDGDEIFFTYAWRVGGSTVSGATGDTLSSDNFVKDEAVSVTVTPSDGDATGAAAGSRSITIQNSPPTFTEAIVTADITPVTEESTLTCEGRGWRDADEDEENYTYRWLIGGVEVAAGATVSGATFDRGESIVCEATADDLDDEGAVRTAAPVTIENALPTLDGVTLSDTAPRTGDTLTVTPGATDDLDGDEVSVSYAWTIDGEDAGTGTSLDLDGVGRGSTIEVVATPTDGRGDGESVTATATVANTAPTITSVTLGPDEVQAGDTITASVDVTDPDPGDDEGFVFTYTWFVDGTEVMGETGATLSTGFVGGQDVTVEVVVSDGLDDSTAVTSAPLTVGNTAPVLDGATLDQTELREGTTVTCVPGTATDVDGDPVTFEYLWSTGATTATIDGSAFDKGDVVSCTVTPTDTIDDGTPQTTTSLTVLNTAPTLTASLPGSLTAAADIMPVVSVDDPDPADSPDVTYTWSVNGSEVEAGASLPTSLFEKGDSFSVTIVANDGQDDSNEVTLSGTIDNAEPVIESLSFNTTEPGTEDDLVVTAAATDADDGDMVTLSYQWALNGTDIAGATTATLSSEEYVKGDEVTVTVTATDTIATVSETSEAIEVVNTAPTTPVVTTVFDELEDDEDLLCLIDTVSTDPDTGDTVTYEISWTVDGMAYTGPTSTTDEPGDTIPSAETTPEEVWECSVVATDTFDDSEAATATVEIAYCTERFVAADAVGVDYASSSIDDPDTVLYETEEGTPTTDLYSWYQFDLTSVDDTWTVRAATLEVYADSEPLGSPALEVAVSDSDGWDSTDTMLASSDIVDDGTVSVEAVSTIPTDDYTVLDLDLDEWTAADDLTDNEVSLGVFTRTDGSLTTLFGTSESGKEPTLMLTFESCD